jgi:hypothetical protein
MARWVTRKRREDDWIFFTCFQADGVDERFKKILWLKGGDKVTRWVSRKRENGFGSSVLTFAKEQEDAVDERFVKSRDRKER